MNYNIQVRQLISPANPETISVLRFQASQLWFNNCETISHITTITSKCNHSGFLCKKELKHKRLNFNFKVQRLNLGTSTFLYKCYFTI